MTSFDQTAEPSSRTAHAVVSAVPVLEALDLLTEIAAPLHVRLELTAQAFALTTHGDEPWWTTVTVPATSPTKTAVSAIVARLDFRQAVEAEAVLVPDATCSVTIVNDDVVRYGGFAFAAMSDPSAAPPNLDGPSIDVELWKLSGARYEHPDGRVFELPATSLQRFTDRGIERADLVDDRIAPYLVGHAASEHGIALELIAQGTWTPT